MTLWFLRKRRKVKIEQGVYGWGRDRGNMVSEGTPGACFRVTHAFVGEMNQPRRWQMPALCCRNAWAEDNAGCPARDKTDVCLTA